MGEDDDAKRRRRDKSKRRASKDSRSGHSRSPRRGGHSGATTDDDTEMTEDESASSKGKHRGKSGKGGSRGKSSKNKGKSSKGRSGGRKNKSSRHRPKDDSEGEGGGGGGGDRLGLCCFPGGGDYFRRRKKRGKNGGKRKRKHSARRRESEKRRSSSRKPTIAVEAPVETKRSPSVSSRTSTTSRKSIPKEAPSSGLRKSGSKSSMTESINSKKVLFNEVLAVREIPNKEVVKAAERARTLPGYASTDEGFPQHYYPGGDPFTAGSESSGDFNDLRGMSHSNQSMHGAESEAGGRSPQFPLGALESCAGSLSRTGSLMSERNPSLRMSLNASASACSTRSRSGSRCGSRSGSQSRGGERKTPSVRSLKSVTLDEDAHLFSPGTQYDRSELIAMMERLVYGINNRECLKARYDEESTRLGMGTEYQQEKIAFLRQKLEKLSTDQKDLGEALKESAEHLTQNLLQLSRERKRIAGAVDLREDFERFLQEQISAKNQYVQDYAQTLGRLEILFDDSTLQWVQRETMLSTEAEALDRVRRSAEKESAQLQAELRNQEANYAARAAQNNKLSQVVERELEKYARRQQGILKYNEKRIRALEGCVRTMQLDREVMYGEIAENRYRLKEVVEGRISALMDKVHSYKILLKNVREEIESVLGTASCKPGSILNVSTMLSSYARSIAALDLCALELQVKAAKEICDKAEQAFRKKNLQKKDLVEIRQTFVDSQKQTMLDSEDEYFLMEPVDVPGIESNNNFQRSLDDFTKEVEFASGAATAARVFAFAPERDAREAEVGGTCGRPVSPYSEADSCGPCNDTGHPLEEEQLAHHEYETHSEPKTACERTSEGAATACSDKIPPGSKRRAVLNSLSMRSSRNIGNAFKKLTHVGKR